MNCPIDNATLVMSDRNGIEIDYCPQCRGVWLDRGELDKIIERAEPAPAEPRRDDLRYEERRDDRRDDYKHSHKDGYYGEHGQPYRKKKKENFLADLFEF